MTETIEYVDAAGVATALYKVRGGAGRHMPPVLLDERPVPGSHGSRFRGCRFDAASPIIPILIDGASHEAYLQELRDVASALNPDKGVGKLRATSDVGVREQTAIYEAGLDHPENAPAYGVAAVMFRAFDPFWYDTATVIGTFTTGTAAAFFPILPIRLASSEVFASATLANSGDVEAWPIWTITGPGSGLVLRNDTTGKTLALGYTIDAGEVVTIDTSPGEKTVTLNDGTNLFGSLTARQFWPVARGNNAVSVELVGATADSSVQVSYRRRWLSA
jgi:hypothetical protein